MSDYTVVFVSLEMAVPEFPQELRHPQFRGGLGLLAADILEALAKKGIRAFGITPFYEFDWMTRKPVNYGASAIKSFFPLESANGRSGMTNLNVYEVDRGGAPLYGLHHPVFNLLYTGDRWQRLRQEILLAYAASALIKKRNIKPDVVWLQEGHTALAIPVMKEDPYFSGTKFLFTTHTSVPAGLETFSRLDWFDELGINKDKYSPIFVQNGVIDMIRGGMALADWVNAVSEEHAEVSRGMFPEFAHKISGIRNGSSRELWLSPRIKALGDSPNRSEFWQAHQEDKAELLDLISGFGNPSVASGLRELMMGWVRRITWYKHQYVMLEPVIRAICAPRGETAATQYGDLPGLGIKVFCAGRAHEDDGTGLEWMSKFEQWTNHDLRGKFFFLPQYGLDLLQTAVRGSDIWFNCPLIRWEACGQSDQRAAINGVPSLTTRSGGAKEYVREFDPATLEGNGFYISPYEPLTVYNKLKTISDLYYAWIENKDEKWLSLTMNAFEAGKEVDSMVMIAEYEKIFKKLINGQKTAA